MFTKLFAGLNLYLDWALNIHYPWGSGMAARIVASSQSITQETLWWHEITSGSGFGRIVSSTSTTVYVFDNVRNLKTGQRLVFPTATGGQKEGIIQSVDVPNKTVTFATAPASPAISNGAVFYSMPVGRAEGSLAPESRASLKREYSNDLQIFQDTAMFSGNRLAQAVQDPVSVVLNTLGQQTQSISLPREMLDVMSQITNEMHRAIWLGTPNTPGNPKQFKGLRYFFDNPDTTYGFPVTTTSSAANPAKPTAKEVANLLGTMIDTRQWQGGLFDENTRIIVPTSWMAALKEDTSRYLVQRADSDRQLGINPMVYADRDVELLIETDKHLAGMNEGYLLNDSGFTLKYNSDRFMKAEHLAKDGDRERIQILTEAAPEFYGIQAAVRGKLV